MNKLLTHIECLFMLCCITLLSGCAADRTIEGSWKDIDGNYYIVFDTDGTYKDSTLGAPMPYFLQDGVVVVVDPSGDFVYNKARWYIDGDLLLYVGGQERRLTRSEVAVDAFSVVLPEDMGALELKDKYVAKSAVITGSAFCIYEGNYYTLDSTLKSSKGKLFCSTEDSHYSLCDTENKTSDVMFKSSDGVFLGSLPLTSDENLEVLEDYSNKSLGLGKGYLLEGVLYAGHSGVTYTFSSDSVCVKSAYGIGDVVYNYYISENGLITLGSTTGVADDDYMLLDTISGQVYRFVYQQDSWFQYLSALALHVESEEETLGAHYSKATPKNYIQYLPYSYSTSAESNYAELYQSDLVYTERCVSAINCWLRDLENDEAARQEYLAQQQLEQQKFFDRVAAQEAERAKLQEELNKRVKSEVKEDLGKKDDTSSWYDRFLPSGSTNSSSQGSGDDDPPVSEPEGGSNNTIVDSPATVPQEEEKPFDPVFTIEFVCTCVNCHTLSLPVSMGTSDVLLVDRNVLDGGITVRIEGYGNVITRDAVGYATGQNAVCFTDNHNAVKRLSGKQYNVHKVVN